MLAWNNLACEFEGRTIFSGLSGSLKMGERLRICGASGGGKTSLLRILLKLAPPSAGVVTWAGEVRDLAAYVPQEPDLGTEGSVREWVDRVFDYRRNRAARPTTEALSAALEQLGLGAAVLNEDVTQISGGEKQRIALAVALLLPRKVLVLDEPFSALDEASTRLAVAALVRSARAIVYASHVEVVEGLATREVAL